MARLMAQVGGKTVINWGPLAVNHGFARFFRDRRAAVSIIAALSLPALLAFSSLVGEYGHGLLIKTEDQRVADMAAYAGALAYNANGTTASATSAADAVATLNGVPSGSVSANVVSSPTGDGNKAVQVTVSSNLPIYLAQVVGGSSSLPVSAAAYAEMNVASGGCIVALNTAGTGVTVASSAGISADACGVDSNATVTASSSSNITTISVGYDSSSAPSATSSSTIGPPSGKTITITKKLTADPLAGNSAVVALTSHLSTVEGMTSPSAPSVTTGSNITVSASTWTGTLPSGCSTALSSGTYTVTCTSGGTYNFGSFSCSSTCKVQFNPSGSGSTYDFSGGISVSSSATFTGGPGTYNIVAGVTVASSSSASFGAGSFDIGPSTSTCSDGYKYSLCVESSTSLTIAGPSTFTLGGGVYAGSSANVTLGSGTTNSFDIGSSNSGYGVQTSSSSNPVFGDATGSGDLFQVVGSINAASSACVALPDAANHDVDGAVIANSSSDTTFGSGVYTVADYLMDASSSGGSSCNGATTGTADTGVTFVLGAVTTPLGGTCNGMVICVTSSSGMALSAPTSGADEGLVLIGPTNGSSAGALFSSSSSGSLSGAVYLPTGPITIQSSASLGGGSASCLMLIGSEISVTSSSALGSTCTGVGGGSTGNGVVLVQ